jgi:hypothetical protein
VKRNFALLGLVAAWLTACAVPTGTVAPSSYGDRPLDVLPPGFDPALVRSDLLATARDRYGDAAVERALTAPTHLVVKRFAGMAPPPPPGAGPHWRPPTPSAVLVRENNAWTVATATGWRAAQPEPAAELDSLLAEARFWSEPAYVPPCPDAGASLLLLKIPDHAETVRNSTCSSLAERLVSAALRA